MSTSAWDRANALVDAAPTLTVTIDVAPDVAEEICRNTFHIKSMKPRVYQFHARSAHSAPTFYSNHEFLDYKYLHFLEDSCRWTFGDEDFMENGKEGLSFRSTVVEAGTLPAAVAQWEYYKRNCTWATCCPSGVHVQVEGPVDDALQEKVKGNAAFRQNKFDEAIAHYSAALESDPTNGILYANRAACWHAKENYSNSIADADRCVHLKPDWPKGYARKAMSLLKLGELVNAVDTCSTGLKLDPDNTSLQSLLRDAEKELQKQTSESSGLPSRLESNTEEDINIAIFLGPRQLEMIPGIPFQEAMESPMRLYGFDVDILRQIELKAEQLAYSVEDLNLSSDQIKAIVTYTFDDLTNQPERQPYFCLNKELRKRAPADRKHTLQVWGPLLKHLLTGLDKLDNVETEVWRGLQDRAVVEREYKLGRPIQWGAFTSTSMDFNVCTNFVSQTEGVLLKLQVSSGKDIQRLSFLPHEGEILLSPNAVFRASRKPELITSGSLVGWVVLDMVQDAGSRFFS